MTKRHIIILTILMTVIALGGLTVLFTAPSWSSPSPFLVTTTAPATLPPLGSDITVHGSGFSPDTRLWLVQEHSPRSAITAELETFGIPHHFVHRDDRLYVANGTGGFCVIKGLQSPVPLISGTLNSEGQGREIVLNGATALMAAGSGGLQIIDIRDDANPQLLSVLKSVAPALSVASTGKTAYIAAGKSGVKIVDIADPRHPRDLGMLADLPEAYTLHSDEKTLIIATAKGGWIYDLSQPQRPRRLAALPVLGGTATVMARQGETLYWATKSAGKSLLYALDLRNPSSPRLMSTTPLEGRPYGISCSAEQIVLAAGALGTQLIPLKGKSQRAGVTTISSNVRTHHSLLLGSDLWVADNGQLLRLNLNKRTPQSDKALLSDFSPSMPPIVTTDFFVLGNSSGLSIFGRWNGSDPLLLARLPVAGLEQLYLSADQRQLWLASREDSRGKLIGVDISTLHAPEITGEIPFTNTPVILGEAGSMLVISATPNTSSKNNSRSAINSLQLIDISRPRTPSLHAKYDLGGLSNGYCLAGNFFVVMQPDGLLRVLDVSAEGGPREAGTLQMPWLHSAEWRGRTSIVMAKEVAYISSALGKIFVVDLHDLRKPTYLGRLTLSAPVNSLTVSDSFLLAGVSKEGVVVIDMKDMLTPAVLGTIPLPGIAMSFAVQGDQLWYVGSELNGLWHLPLPRPLTLTAAKEDQLVASLPLEPPAGAYRFWLTDKQRHLLLPGVSWSVPRLAAEAPPL